MANIIVQSLYGNTRLNHREVMTALSAAREVINESANQINSINDLDLDELAKIAVGCYEDIKREDIAEILAADINSEVNSQLIKFLSDDDLDNRDDLCDAIKRAFANYFRDQIQEAIEQVQAEIFNHNPFEDDYEYQDMFE